jgi:ribosomal protein S14
MIINYLMHNGNSDLELLTELFLIIKRKNYTNSISKINNACLYTGRVRGICTKYRMSRLTFKKYISYGLVYPLKRISW